MSPRLRCLLIVVLLAGILPPGGLPARAEAPSAWYFRAWQTDEGLPDNSVTGVAQTTDGYLWVATYGGLLRFNGENFAAAALPALYKKSICSMLLDHEGRFWLGMDPGSLVCLASNTARIYNSGDGLPAELVAAMAEDRAGAMWVIYSSIHSSTLCRIKDGQVARFTAAQGLPDGLNAGVTCDARGELWFSKGEQVGVFRQGKLEEKLSFPEPAIRICGAASAGLWICAGSRLLRYDEGHEPEERARLPENAEPQILFEDRAGDLWIGTVADGLFRLQGQSLQKIPTSHPAVDCVSEDREGNIWAGTRGGGLNLIRPSAVELIGREAGLPFEAVASVCVDTRGVVWAAGQSGKITRYDGAKWDVLGAESGWTGDSATCVAADRQGGVWLGSRNDGLYFFHEGVWRNWQQHDGLHTGAVHLLFTAANDDIWVVTGTPSRLQQMRAGQVIGTFELPAPNRSIRALAEGADGTLWAGTLEGQVLRVSGKSLVAEPLVKDAGGAAVRSLATTPDGTLYIGFAGAGIGRLQAGNYARLTTETGLMDDFASQLLADGQGGLWIVGNRGLFRVPLDEVGAVISGKAGRLRSRVFGHNEGLPNFQPSSASSPNVCRGADGRLWFALRSGLLSVRPQDLRDDPAPPPVVLERIRVDDQTVALYDEKNPCRTENPAAAVDLREGKAALRIPPGNHKVEFEFAALSFASPENVQFRYRLDNFDEKWVEAGSQRSARYPRLPAGDYQFQVLACNSAGYWNDTGAVLAVKVPPFFWQTWWFRGLMLGSFTVLVAAIVRSLSFRWFRARMRQLEQQTALERERSRIARDMHDEVGAKLTRLSLLSDMAGDHPGMPAAARGDVREIADTARDTIRSFEEIVWAVNPKNDTLADLIHYLCRYAEDYFEGTPVQCSFDLPAEIPSLVLPTEARHEIFLAAKEALNNVLKHAGAGHVRVRLILETGGFSVMIDDDGCGFDADSPPKRAGGGNGLENIGERLRSIGGQFKCESQPRQGTRLVFAIATNPVAAP